MSEILPYTLKCFLCGDEFSYEPLNYAGRCIRPLGIHVCHRCHAENRKGLAPRHEAKLIAHLEAQSLPAPARNRKGRIVIGK